MPGRISSSFPYDGESGVGGVEGRDDLKDKFIQRDSLGVSTYHDLNVGLPR